MIKRIRLVGCQSWEDCTITLSQDKINIVKAPNQTGKSVLFKMFKISVSPKFYPPRKRKKLIRWGCSDAKAIYEFTDGSTAVVIVQPTRVLYMFRESADVSWSSYVDPPQKMIDELGFLVNSDGSFIANIIDTDQNLMLVDADSKATIEFVNLLCNCAAIDDYKSKVAELRKVAADDLYAVQYELSNVTRQLKEIDYVDVPKLQEQLNHAICVKDVFRSLLSVGKCLHNFGNSLEFAKDYDSLETVLSVVSKAEQVDFHGIQPQSFSAENETLLSVLEKMESINLQKLQVKECKVDDRILEMLESLEEIQLHKIVTLKEPPDTALVNVLSSLEQITVRGLYTLRQPPDVALADLLANLEDMRDGVFHQQGLLKRLSMLQEDISSLEEDFKNSGAEHECPIYGKVIFDGETCVPYNT